METTTKKCIKCGRELPLDEFYTNKGTKDGHQNECKECTRERSKHNYGIRKKQIEEALENAKKTKLSNFSPRDMMHELAKQGYYGIIHFDVDKEKEVEIDGHKGIFRYRETQNIDITNF